MKLFEMTETTGHEQVLFYRDRPSGLKAIVAIHDATPGTAMGATRLWPYASEAAALHDVLRLSRGMTYKAACANIPVGGAKAVIIADPADKSNELLRAYGRFVESLQGRFVTGQDVNLTADDVRQIQTETQHVVGGQERCGGPIAATALGVLLGIQAAVEYQLECSELKGLKVAVQGLGNVGSALCEHLHEHGAKLYVTDIDSDRVDSMVARYGAVAVAPDDIYAQPVDVFSPCAMGGVLNERTIGKLKASVVAGSANNQLAEEQRDSQLLNQQGILYCPDYVINAGGLINVYHEKIGYDEVAAFRHVQGIYSTLMQIFQQSKEMAIATHTSAQYLADMRISEAKGTPSAMATAQSKAKVNTQNRPVLQSA